MPQLTHEFPLDQLAGFPAAARRLHRVTGLVATLTILDINEDLGAAEVVHVGDPNALRWCLQPAMGELVLVSSLQSNVEHTAVSLATALAWVATQPIPRTWEELAMGSTLGGPYASSAPFLSAKPTGRPASLPESLRAMFPAMGRRRRKAMPSTVLGR